MKNMYMMLCVLGLMAGCKESEPPLTPDQYKEQYEAAQVAAVQATIKPNTTIIPKGPGVRYSVELTIICVQGVQYYYRQDGWSVWFAPVFNKTNLLIQTCTP